MTDIPNRTTKHMHGQQCYMYTGTCPEYENRTGIISSEKLDEILEASIRANKEEK